MDKKVCVDCYTEKPLTSFQLSKNGYYRKSCKSCRKLYYDEKKKANPEIYNNRQRTSRLKRKYNLDPERLEQLKKSQDYKCAICKKRSKELVIDHDHDLGHVRGLLCSKCNIGLGNFKDNPENLINAISYLEGYKLSKNL